MEWKYKLRSTLAFTSESRTYLPLLTNMQVPSYISRSVAGSYDNEAVAIFALIFTFYLYVKVCSTIVFLHFVSFFLILKFYCF
jgi:hypothetical protein